MGGLGVVLEANPMTNVTVDAEGLPSYIYNGYGFSKGKIQNAVKFHPGMHRGQLRIEGPGGFYNQSMPFTPRAWTESGNKYHTLHLTLGADGQNILRFLDADEGQRWEVPWEHQLTCGRYIPALYGWLDLGDWILQIGRIGVRLHLA